MNRLRTRRGVVAFALLLVASLLGVPAVSAGTGTHSTTDGTALERLEIDAEAPAVIKLRCRSVTADTPAVGCGWRFPDDAGIATFQLWKLQVAPVEGTRTLVAELGTDEPTFTDTAVEAPAAYLYAVLGLDDAGEVVARSRVDGVRLKDPSIERLRLDCAGVDGDTPAIACGWTAPETAEVVTYSLLRKTHGEDRVEIAAVGGDATSYTDTAVACDVRYRYKLIGYDADGNIVAKSGRDAAACGEHERDAERRAAKAERKAERAAAGAEEVDGDTTLTTADEPEQVRDRAEDRGERRDRPSGDTRDRRGRGR